VVEVEVNQVQEGREVKLRRRVINAQEEKRYSRSFLVNPSGSQPPQYDPGRML